MLDPGSDRSGGFAQAEEALRTVRLLVVAPGGEPAAREVVRALRALDGDVDVELVRDVAAVHALLDAGRPADLVVAPDDGTPALHALLSRTREDGPPVLVLGPATGADAARELALLRQGAAEYLPADAALARRLPAAALDPIRRHRRRRDRAWLASRIGARQRFDEQILENLDSGLLGIDADGAIGFANGLAAAILEGDASLDLEGRSLWEWLPPGSPAAAPVRETLDGGQRLRGVEVAIVRGDGHSLPLGISCAPLDADASGRRGAVVVLQDLSEVRQLREQVLQTEKMASIGALAAGVAHEINNPVGFIHANLHQMSEYIADLEALWERVAVLQKAVDAGDAAAAREASTALQRASEEADVDFVLRDLGKAVRESQEGSERIRHIVQDLRDFARQDSGLDAPADLNLCVDSTASIAWTMMKHSVVLEKDYGELPAVACNAMQLKQVVMNLLVNACQAIEEKYGASGRLGRIVVRTRALDDAVEIEVEDDGTGIAPDARDRIFDPFFTTKEVGHGTGLGLSTSFQIVRRHGGSLRVESEPGEGARFIVRLPIAAAPGAGDAPGAPTVAGGPPG